MKARCEKKQQDIEYCKVPVHINFGGKLYSTFQVLFSVQPLKVTHNLGTCAYQPRASRQYDSESQTSNLDGWLDQNGSTCFQPGLKSTHILTCRCVYKVTDH